MQGSVASRCWQIELTTALDARLPIFSRLEAISQASSITAPIQNRIVSIIVNALIQQIVYPRRSHQAFVDVVT